MDDERGKHGSGSRYKYVCGGVGDGRRIYEHGHGAGTNDGRTQRSRLTLTSMLPCILVPGKPLSSSLPLTHTRHDISSQNRKATPTIRALSLTHSHSQTLTRSPAPCALPRGRCGRALEKGKLVPISERPCLGPSLTHDQYTPHHLPHDRW